MFLSCRMSFSSIKVNLGKGLRSGEGGARCEGGGAGRGVEELEEQELKRRQGQRRSWRSKSVAGWRWR